jgi:hypothetical protein
MAVESGQPQETDLDKTDRLPILEGDFYDPDVADDAVRMERVGSAPGASLAATSEPAEFVRPSPVDLPSLAESMRSVEERIARQTAEYDALTRSYERTRDAEAAAITRANAAERDLAKVRTTLESEQIRLQEMERALTEKDGSVEGVPSRAEEERRESVR